MFDASLAIASLRSSTASEKIPSLPASSSVGSSEVPLPRRELIIPPEEEVEVEEGVEVVESAVSVGGLGLFSRLAVTQLGKKFPMNLKRQRRLVIVFHRSRG